MLQNLMQRIRKIFILTSASTGTVFGDVLINGGGDEQRVTISFTQMAQCKGNYDIVASTYGEDTLEY